MEIVDSSNISDENGIVGNRLDNKKSDGETMQNCMRSSDVKVAGSINTNRIKAIRKNSSRYGCFFDA